MSINERERKILITGAKGFVGKNLVLALKSLGFCCIYEYDVTNSEEEFEKFCEECDFVFHLAGVNRPQDPTDFIKGNYDFTAKLLNTLNKYSKKVPIVLTSSIQAALKNDYGNSKLKSEQLLRKYAKANKSNVLIYRLANLFGKECRPNYNSVIATFCYNIARGQPIQVNDARVKMKLIYIDDLINEFINCLDDKANVVNEYCEVPIAYKTTLGFLAKTISDFGAMQNTLSLPYMADELTKKLYSTYLSYLKADELSYPLKMNIDERGSFSEVFKTESAGQISVNIIKPNIVKGNHWHNSKNEKFLVVNGSGVIRLRKKGESQIYEYFVSGNKLEIINIIPGYTHNIANIGEADMITIMWANEIYNPDLPDTFFEKV